MTPSFLTLTTAFCYYGGDSWNETLPLPHLHEVLTVGWNCECRFVVLVDRQYKLVLLVLDGLLRGTVVPVGNFECRPNGARVQALYFAHHDVLLVRTAAEAIFCPRVSHTLQRGGLDLDLEVRQLATRTRYKDTLEHELETESFAALWHNARPFIFFPDEERGLRWCRLDQFFPTAPVAARSGVSSYFLLLLSQSGKSVFRFVFPKMAGGTAEDDEEADAAVAPLTNRIALLEQAARRLAASLTALANATDNDQLELTEPELEKLWCPFSSWMQIIHPVNEHLYIIGRDSRLFVVAHFDEQYLEIPFRFKAMKTVQCFLSETDDPVLSIVCTGFYVRVRLSYLHQALMDDDSEKEAKHFERTILPGGKKTFTFAGPKWIVITYENKFSWIDMEDGRRMDRMVHLTK
jgi:hypothetical protein